MEPRLGRLMVLLEARGLRLGVDERLRLSLALARVDEDDAEALGRVVIAVVVKDPAWTPEVEAVIAAWRAENRPLEPESEREASPLERAAVWEPRSPAALAVEVAREQVGGGRWRWLAGGVAAIGIVGLVLARWPSEPAPVAPPEVQAPPEAPAEAQPAPPAPEPEPAPPAPRTIQALTPHFDPPVPFQPPRPWAAIVSGLLAALLALAAWIINRLRPAQPEALPTPEPRDVVAPPPGARLRPGEILRIDPSEQEDLGAGLSQRVAGEPTPILDVQRTVAETAAAMGLPRLRFERRREPLGLWLWVDVTARDHELEALSGELRAALEAAGVPTELAEFQGVPDALWTAEGVVSPFDLEAQRRGARVVILTDGLVLRAARQADPLGERVAPLLAELAGWPGLLWVDFGGDLRRLLGPGPRVARPEEAVSALSGARLRPEGSPTALDLWRACCALCPEPVGPEAALRLRARLALDVSPWWVGAVSVEEGERAPLFGWLDHALAYTRVGLPDALRGALTFWREALAESEQEAAGAPGWPGSEAEARLRISTALLDLWERQSWREHNPIQLLWSLREGPLGAEIRARVGGLADAVHVAPGAIRLPWRVSALDTDLRLKLAQIGFGAAVGLRLEGTTAPPGRRALGYGALAGAGLAALVAGNQFQAEIPEVTLVEQGRGEEPGWAICADGACRAGGRSVSATLEQVHAGATVGLKWSLDDQDCQEALPTGLLLRCWTDGVAPLPWEGRPTFSAVQLMLAEGQQPSAEILACAAAFLGSGDADVVVVSADEGDLDALTAPSDGQALRLRPDEAERISGVGCRKLLSLHERTPAATALGLTRGGAEPAFELGPWSPIVVRAPRCGDGALDPGEVCDDGGRNSDTTPDACRADCTPARCGDGVVDRGHGERCDLGARNGGARCDATCQPPAVAAAPQPAQPEPVPAPIVADAQSPPPAAPKQPSRAQHWVSVPADDGVIGDDDSAFDYEKPRWSVRFTQPFSLLDTEVTRAQYAAAIPAWSWDGTDPDNPVTGVSWTEARAYCVTIGARLPAEAEWEYAARAGAETSWPQGDDASALGDYAWYSGNSGNQLHPVAQKKANAWGLYDMLGNAWEWVEDNYDPKAWKKMGKDPVVDPSPIVNNDDNSRVLRGGSAWNDPENLRFSGRGRDYPRNRGQGFGFRCARGPRRQP